ncbi:Heat shock 70 kDa protein [Rhynchospora pubera]|uniref:Heat shock 70 kDa protein n=1 Tax=Rhynchospora pubera TaxID=906938 RepID=A0AAV8BPZ0_9POAL|nr:Heat shock 70 kDa protein [Rhynchospora pubera]
MNGSGSSSGSVRKGPAIGIDLGSEYTRVALLDGKQFRMILDDHGKPAMPSYVAFVGSEVLVGEAARKQAAQNPINTIFDVIRLIGRKYNHPLVRNDMWRWPFKVVASQNERLLIEVVWNGKLWHFTPVEICSLILTQVKKNAETYLGTTITDAVITVPVQFNYEQREAIKVACTIAHLNVLQIVSSPAASALLFGSERQLKITRMITSMARSIFTSEPEEYNMVIFDLGAGTLDVCLITMKDAVCQVQATAGDVHLGGSDFDTNMINYFIYLLKESGHKDAGNIFRDVVSKHRTDFERAKSALFSGGNMTPVMIGSNFFISAEEFNELNKELFLKCVDTINMCLRNAKMEVGKVDEVILVGGSTRIPMLQDHISQYFRGKQLKASNHLETAVACGAALQASFLTMRGHVGKLELPGTPISPNGCDFKVCFQVDENGTLTVTSGKSFPGMWNSITMTIYNIEVSRRKVQEALLCKEVEKVSKVSRTMKSDYPRKRNQPMEKQVSGRPTVGVEKSKKIMGQSSRQHIETKEDAIGIDFGTTYSCIAIWKHNAVKIIENEYGSRATCSCVAFTDTGRLIGDTVNKEQVASNPANSIPSLNFYLFCMLIFLTESLLFK